MGSSSHAVSIICNKEITCILNHILHGPEQKAVAFYIKPFLREFFFVNNSLIEELKIDLATDKIKSELHTRTY